MADAIRRYQSASTRFPEYAEAGSPYRELGRLHRERGDRAAAAAALGRLTALAESDYDANLAEAELREQIGDLRGAAAALERAVFIDPREAELHARLATLYLGLGDHRKAVRERQAILALAPPDRAGAYYQLALAWFEAGDLDEARRAVLRALEAAPSYEPAQQLLLRIRERRGSTR